MIPLTQAAPPDASLCRYALKWADDDGQEPRLNELDAMVTVGRNWMWANRPAMWAQYVAGCLLGAESSVTWREWGEACEEAMRASAGSANGTVAEVLVDMMYEFIKKKSASGPSWPSASPSTWPRKVLA